jgi:hypothetical protein
MVKWTLPLALAAFTGCTTLDAFIADPTCILAEPICQIETTWHNEVVFSPDPTRQGAPGPGIAGRLYLFGEKVGHPRAGDGKVTFDLYDEAQLKAGEPVAPIERWQFDPATLQKLLRKDMIGWGYTVFLPWGTYKPECLSKPYVLKVRYDQLSGTPLFTESPVSFNHPGTNTMRVSTRQGIPGSELREGPAKGSPSQLGPPRQLPPNNGAPSSTKEQQLGVSLGKR